LSGIRNGPFHAAAPVGVGLALISSLKAFATPGGKAKS
jgi:hypothetical protein